MGIRTVADAVQEMREAADATIKRRSRTQRAKIVFLFALCLILTVPTALHIADTEMVSRLVTKGHETFDENDALPRAGVEPTLYETAISFNLNKWGVVRVGSVDALVIDYEFKGHAVKGDYQLIARWNRKPNQPRTKSTTWTGDDASKHQASPATTPLATASGTAVVSSGTTCHELPAKAGRSTVICAGSEYFLVSPTVENGRYPDDLMIVYKMKDRTSAAVRFVLDDRTRRWRTCNLLRCTHMAS
ncbi:hypothetical protein [Aeromicrobium ginsengisoli]|uniref:Uncharacterized protein n=1 Tax=Aeromicrobium ginsengisoli TaxID=363867 RepID=A0A5M4FHH9_9ACTN|nr:hypothetical protein [Aeromicrobium ginsengisoli]KAA1399644.1 hypothetical protein ESP70_002455 [Aeromicrobium ginsengisoli]